MTDRHPDADLDREVGGLRCRDVLAGLSDYLDGDLPNDVRARVDEHLAGCSNCERFGGRVGAIVGTLRSGRARPLLTESQRASLVRGLRAAGALP